MASATVVIQARPSALDPRLVEAAMDPGDRPAQVFWLLMLPVTAPSMVAAWPQTFTLSLDDGVLLAFLWGHGATTLPMVIFSRARLGLDPSVNAEATLIVALIAIGVVAASCLIACAERRQLLEQAADRRRIPRARGEPR